MRIVICFLLLFCSAKSFAQKGYQISVVLSNADQTLLKSLKFSDNVKDSLSVYNEAEKITGQLQFKGYPLAEITSLSFKGKNVNLIINPNQRYQWVRLSGSNLPSALKQATGFKERNYFNAALDITRLQQLFKSVLSYYENTGYPFANVSLDSVVIGQSAISAVVKVQPHQKIVFDTIQMVGSAQISQKYLQSYLNIKSGTEYSEVAVAQIENRLRELPFLSVLRSAEVSFSVEKAVVRIFVNKKNANQFDGILGLQQNGGANKSQLVGNVKLHLQNSLKIGEQLDFSYQGIAQRSQLLDIEANVPHLLNTSFGLNPSLYMYKQDSSFINVDTKLGFTYLLKGNNAFQFFVENKSTSLIATQSYEKATSLPVILDANTLFYGLGLKMEKLDYRYNPQRGYNLVFDVAVGAKKIKRNAYIPAPLYANVPLSSSSYRLLAKADFYQLLAKQLVLAMGNETAFLNGKYLLENELFRLGGQRSLRGFDELSLLATSYSYANLELRYLLSQNSFFFAFYNQAYVQYKTSQQNFTHYPLGIGTGVNFETSLGILSVSYALGKQRNNPLNLRQGKIHFGITALF